MEIIQALNGFSKRHEHRQQYQYDTIENRGHKEWHGAVGLDDIVPVDLSLFFQLIFATIFYQLFFPWDIIVLMSEEPQRKRVCRDQQQKTIYQIITGKLKYTSQPFQQCDLHPDLVIKIRVPSDKQKYLPINSYLTLSHFIASPSKRLQKAYAKAERVILREMQDNRENENPLNLRIRFNHSLQPIRGNKSDQSSEGTRSRRVKEVKVLNEDMQKQIMELNCYFSSEGILDIFSLQYNTIMYILQKQCGFRVKSMLVHDKKLQNKDIYLFLTLPIHNLIKVANRSGIKKQVDYSAFDFYLNDPSANDSRPYRLKSRFKQDRQRLSILKNISRYFRVQQSFLKNDDLIEEQEIQDEELQTFNSCIQEQNLVYEFLRENIEDKLTPQEQAYIFEYNRRRVNQGCIKRYSIIKKRKMYFEMLKQILPKYGYKVRDQPIVYKQFFIPTKDSKNSSFFHRFQSFMLYKPSVVSKSGELALFMTMQKTKLSYLLIKRHFKVNYLSKMGIEVFTLDNKFQKLGGGQNQLHNGVKGGIDGQNLADSWKMYSLFSDMKVVRNFLGERVAYEALYNNYVIAYLLSIIAPFILLFIVEFLFRKEVWIYTVQLEALVFCISFNMFMVFFQEAENQFVKNYCEDVTPKMFLSKFSGPFQRNLISDETNEYARDRGWRPILKNLLCSLIIFAILTAFGGIFYGLRLLLVKIYEPLEQYKVTGTFSLAHLIVYFIFYLIQSTFRKICIERMINLIVELKNPPNDEEQRQVRDLFTLFYTLGVELIVPFFLLILEPFLMTSCYADQCRQQLKYYVYTRYLFVIAGVIIKFIELSVFRFMKRDIDSQSQKREKKKTFFQERLIDLLEETVKNEKKPEHVQKKMGTIVILQNFALYCTFLPISSFIVLMTVFIDFLNFRTRILYQQRRPINRSQRIIRLSNQLWYVYYLGVYINSWININLLEFVQLRMQFLIQFFSTIITYQSIFLLKFLITLFYCLFILLLGYLVSQLAKNYSGSIIYGRKDNKFKEYLFTKGGVKFPSFKNIDLQPIRTMFRTYNPEKILQNRIDSETYNSYSQEQIYQPNFIQSATSINPADKTL